MVGFMIRTGTSVSRGQFSIWHLLPIKITSRQLHGLKLAANQCKNMAARPFKFLFANSTLHRMVASKLRITTQIQRTLTTTTPCGNALTLFRGTSGHFVPVISRSVTCVQHNQFSPRLFDVTRVRRYTSNLGRLDVFKNVDYRYFYL